MKINNKIEKLNYIIIIFLIIAMPLFQLIKVYSASIFKSTLLLRTNFSFILWLLLPLLIFITFYYIKKKIIKWNKFTILLTILAILMIISVMFSIDITTAIYGYNNRNEGLLSILSYYFILLNCSVMPKNKIYKVLNIFILVGLFQVIYAILQTVFRFDLIYKFHIRHMASGLCGNPNFFGSYMLILLGITIGLYIFCKKNRKFYFFSSISFMVGLTLSQSTGPLLGLLCLLIFMIVFFFIRKIKNTKLWLIGLSLFTVFIITLCTSNMIYINIHNDEIDMSYSIAGDLLRLIGIKPDEIAKITGTNDDKSSIASGRLIIWENSLEIVKKNPITGVGIDNFRYAYPTTGNDVIYDKAHNEYLQIMTTAGIPTCLVYLVFLFLILLKGILSKNKLILILLIPFVGYSIQAFFNISVVEVAPYYFMICGFIIGLYKENINE